MNLIYIDSKLEELIQKLFENNGPDPEEYEGILKLIDAIDPGEMATFREFMQPILNPATIIGFSFTKPFGYNGDFFIIEKIYQHYVNPDEKYKKWDEFFHTFPAAIAVVNRKTLAKEVLTKLNAGTDGATKNVMILGSGPVTEVYEYFNQIPTNNLIFDLLDLDNRSIAYAKNKHRKNLQFMTFHNQNVIRYTPEKKYDLIWSAGLFDYFKDKHFVFMIKKYYEFVNEGGEMIIGNFNVENPSRKIMEVLGDWFLYHREAEELIEFAVRAGIPFENIEVISEPLGINLFLKLKK
ncbi:MAG: class I SAM-dependent methyltransferase [Bacteroidales bacterium]|nr:class I SAM-dependent methyltransferase [Bacteroidales bacterium]